MSCAWCWSELKALESFHHPDKVRIYNLQVDMRGVVKDGNKKAPTVGYFEIMNTEPSIIALDYVLLLSGYNLNVHRVHNWTVVF